MAENNIKKKVKKTAVYYIGCSVDNNVLVSSGIFTIDHRRLPVYNNRRFLPQECVL
jgi:hypothetical protein